MILYYKKLIKKKMTDKQIINKIFSKEKIVLKILILIKFISY